MHPKPEDNVDKTENWGHFSTGVVIADVTADVTTHTPHMFKWMVMVYGVVKVNSKLQRQISHCK